MLFCLISNESFKVKINHVNGMHLYDAVIFDQSGSFFDSAKSNLRLSPDLQKYFETGTSYLKALSLH